MKSICIYHGNCADGFGAAWAVRKALGDQVEFHKGMYGEEPPEVAGREVIIVDFSYKRETLIEMAEVADSILILDHHKTAEDDLGPLLDQGIISGLFDMDKSGAMLAWEWFNRGDEPPALIRHIQDRDLWRFELEGTREIQAAVYSFPYDFDVWDKLMASDVHQLRSEGQAINRKHFKDIEEFIALAALRMTIAGHDVPALNAPYIWSSDAGHIMSKGEQFAACYWDEPDHRVFSLRSASDGADVSEIAKRFGGGGHKHAAGFRVSHGTSVA